jgi:hypothetical protein
MQESIVVNGSDFAGLECLGVAHLSETRTFHRNREFATDERISSNPDTNRQLEKWTDDSSAANSALEGLDGSAYKAGSWNQFDANKKLFGIDAKFTEESYTTKIDRSSEHYRERSLHAAKLAAEIEDQNKGKKPARAGKKSRSGADISDDENEDEEMKYGAVVGERGSTYVKGGGGGNTNTGKNSNNKSSSNSKAWVREGTPAPASTASAAPVNAWGTNQLQASLKREMEAAQGQNTTTAPPSESAAAESAEDKKRAELRARMAAIADEADEYVPFYVPGQETRWTEPEEFTPSYAPSYGQGPPPPAAYPQGTGYFAPPPYYQTPQQYQQAPMGTQPGYYLPPQGGYQPSVDAPSFVPSNMRGGYEGPSAGRGGGKRERGKRGAAGRGRGTTTTAAAAGSESHMTAAEGHANSVAPKSPGFPAGRGMTPAAVEGSS